MTEPGRSAGGDHQPGGPGSESVSPTSIGGSRASVPNQPPPAEMSLSEELRLRLDRIKLEKAAKLALPAEGGSDTVPWKSLSEELRRRISLRKASSASAGVPPPPEARGNGSAKITHWEPARDFAWAQELRSEHAAGFRNELLRRLDFRPSGERIRTLRAVLGWTQRTAAVNLGISVRTLIRHERGHHRTLWPRLQLVLRLRELESEHAQELIAYLTSGGPAHA